MTWLARCSAGLALLACAVPAGATVVLRATSVTVDQPGDVADVCVVLDSGGAAIAGTQNDLVWDGSCATLPNLSACRINPASGKQLFGDVAHLSDATYRALVLSFSDVNPIPDGELYCCGFEVEAAPGACCAIQVTQPAAASPSGERIAVVSTGAQVCVAGGVPTASPTPTIPPVAPIVDTTHDSGGCQVGARPSAPPAALSALVLALFVAVRRRRQR